MINFQRLPGSHRTEIEQGLWQIRILATMNLVQSVNMW